MRQENKIGAKKNRKYQLQPGGVDKNLIITLPACRGETPDKKYCKGQAGKGQPYDRR